MKVITKVARQHAMASNEIKKEMAFAIEKGFNSPDNNVQAMWKELFPDGNQPTPEQFIKVLAKKIKRKL